MFGQPRAPFGGSTSSFGTSFGTPSTTAPGFGSTSFGRTSFGNPQQTTSFGTTTTPFGGATSSGTSLFGTQQPASGGLFGQPSQQQSGSSFPTSGFGSTSGGGLFGQTQQPTSTATIRPAGLFGSTATSGFGTQQSTQSRPFGFGQTTTSSTTGAGGLFGTTPSATGGGLFSSTPGFGATGGAVSGTTVKYEPVTGTDTMTRNGVSTNIRTRIEVISTMKEYESKSLEELRVEDYLANRKGPGQGATLGGFGQTPQATSAQPQGTGLFGSGTSTSLFGTSKPPENKTLFGTGTTSGFGATSGGGLFGTGTSTAGFGQTSTAPATSFSFNQGTQQQQQKTGGFAFGATPTSTPSLFGTAPQQQQQQQQQQQPSFGFGGFGFQLGQNNQQQNPSGGLFGNQKPGFFSNQNTGTGLFGSKPAGTTQPIAGGFGATSFGSTPNTSTSGGLFGAQNNQNKTGMFSGFGSSGFGTTGLFGQNNNQQKTGSLTFGPTPNFNPGMGQNLGSNTGMGLFNASGTNTSVGLGGGGLLNNNTGLGMPQQTAMGVSAGGGAYPDLGKLVKALTDKPYMKLPGEKSSPADKSTSLIEQSGSKLTSSNLKPTYVLSPTVAANNKLKPKPINKNNNQGNDRHWLFKGLDDPNEESSEEFLKPKKYPSVRKLNLRVFNTSKGDSSVSSPSISTTAEKSGGDAPSPLTTPVSPVGEGTPRRNMLPLSHDNSPTPDIIKGREKIKSLHLRSKPHMNDTLADLNVVPVSETTEENAEGAENEEKDSSGEADKENISIFDVSGAEDIPAIVNKSSDKPHPAGIKLSRSGYFTLPSLDILGEMVDSEGQCLVENFTVGRYGYGNVCFLGVTDVAGIDLDAVVFILRKQIEVYPEGTQKPPQGQELNKPAIITLDCVWPVDKTTREVIKSSERLQTMGWSDYLERQCVKMEATFLEYRPETGSWVFKVKHFSKYGLQEDDNEEEMVTVPPKTNVVSPLSAHRPPLGPPAGHLPPLPMRTSGPPATALTSPPQFGLGHMVMASLPTKPGMQQRHLDSPSLQDSQVIEDDQMDSFIAKEAEESASMTVVSPSAERLTVVSRIAPKTVQLAKWQMFGGEEEEEESQQPTRESTPTPQIPRGSVKKLILSTDATMNTSQRMTSSPLPTEPVKAKIVLQAQPITLSSPPKANMQTESCPTPELRDPRSEYLLLQSGSDIGRELGHIPPQHQTALVPLESSLLNGKDRLNADMGAFMGRTFRVGWGPGWNFAHSGPKLTPSLMEEDDDLQLVKNKALSLPSPASFLFMGAAKSQPKKTVTADVPRYNLAVETLHTAHQSPHQLLEASLECVLEYSVVTCDEISDSTEPLCPHFRPVSDVELLHQLAETAASFSEKDPTISNIFELCVALWGRLDFYSPESDGESEYAVSRARVESLSLWLEAVSSAAVQEEVERAHCDDQNEDSYLDAVFSYLTARQISEACVLAQDKGDHHLALLLAQTCFGQDAPREILSQQLANWVEGGSDALMAPSRLVLYALMAAAPTHQASHTTVNTCQGLDWKRALGLHLWYVCPATATIAEALQEYEQAAGLKGDSPSYCDRPYPPYVMNQTLPDQRHVSFDVCYHLLKLYTDPMHQLEVLLNPSTITPDPIDVSVSWLLWRVLESLGYIHLSEQVSANLHLSMAALLESAGHWHWAAFVLLNMGDELRRRKEVQELIRRHIEVDQEELDPLYREKESFLVEKLKIPQKWIHQAKSLKARSLNLVYHEAWYLIKADEYDRAHSIFIDTIAPTCIINEDHERLNGYLQELSNYAVCSSISDWATGGGVYADYLDVCTVVEDMKNSGDPTPDKLEKLRPCLLSLCTRLNNLKCTTATHRLCLSEMSRVVVGVLRAVVGEGSNATQVLSQQLSSLPLTQDYALAELNMITSHYLTHLGAER